MALRSIALNSIYKNTLCIIALCINTNWLLAQKAELILPLGHTSIISKVVTTKDQKYLLSSSRDKTIKIWNIADRKEIKSYEGHDDGVNDIALSANSKFFFSASSDNKIMLWDIRTGKMIRSFSNHSAPVRLICLSADNKNFASYSDDRTLQVSELNTGNAIRNYMEESPVFFINEYAAGNYVYANKKGEIVLRNLSDNNKDERINTGANLIWACNTGNIILYITGKNELVWYGIKERKSLRAFQLPSDGKFNFAALINENAAIISTNEGEISLVDSKIQKLGKTKSAVTSACLLADNKFALACNDRIIYKLDISAKVKITSFLMGHAYFFNQAAIAPITGVIATAGKDNSIRTFNINNNYNKRLTSASDEILSISVSKNEKQLLAASKDKSVYNWNLDENKLISVLSEHKDYVTDINYVNDSVAVSVSKDTKVIIWDLLHKKSIRNLSGHKGGLTSCAVSDDGKFVASSGTDSTVKIWEVNTGKLLETFPSQRLNGSQKLRFLNHHFYSTGSLPSIVKIDPVALTSKIYDPGFNIWDIRVNENQFITNSQTSDLIQWDNESNQKLNSFKGHKRQANGIFYYKKYMVTSGFDQSIRFWDKNTGKEICAIYFIDSADWVVLSPGGLFDATPGAMKLMYYSVGFETIELDQLKDRYYEPNLLQKALGITDETSRNVDDLEEVKLYPGINANVNTDDRTLRIKLKNQGGGIGRTVVFINGKEIASDARGGNVDANTDSAAISLNILNHPYLVNGNNTIEVKAYNADGYLASRGVVVTVTENKETKKHDPSLFVVCIGTSDYSGNSIDLKYASKDATDIHKALLISGKKLFTTQKVESYLITTDSASKIQPTKKNIKATFEEIAKKATAEDVLVVYLSGHGINVGGANGDFYYLTKEAHAANAEAYADLALRNSVSVSATELTDLLKQIPALKQVLIIDACASGRLVENLISKRDISSSTIRALDRMRDRTGMHIITGCAADAVSYEASRFGQGLLTYSLLEGIKGASLRENEFVDVNTLFQNSRERVPLLASGIGGIQEPRVFSPFGAESFDIGQVDEAGKREIPLAKAKPMFIRSSFIDVNESEDVLGLGKRIDNSLTDYSARGSASNIIFIDVRDFPDAYKLSGTYQQADGEIKLKMKIKSPAQEVRTQLSAPNVDELNKLILSEIEQLMKLL